MSKKLDSNFYPLSDNQLSILIESIENKDSIKYNTPILIRLKKNIDLLKLKSALKKNIQQHPYLKTQITKYNDEFLQKKVNSKIDDIKIINVDKLDIEIIKNEIKAFNLLNNQLFQIKLYNSPDEIALFMDFHQIIYDEESIILFLDDLSRLYEDKTIKREIVSGWEYANIKNENKDSYNYFKEKLSNYDESTTIVPDTIHESSSIKKIIKKIKKDKISKICEINNIDKLNLFLSSVMLNLNKFTFSDKILISSTYHGRDNPDYYNTQATLSKRLFFAYDMSDRNISINTLIQNIDNSLKKTIRHLDYPYHETILFDVDGLIFFMFELHFLSIVGLRV